MSPSPILKKLAVLVAGILSATALAKPDPDQPTPQRAYCNLVKTCQVADKLGTCTEALSAPIAGVDLDQTYCGWVRGFSKRNILPKDAESKDMWQYMGSKYHVMYVVADTVPMSVAALDHLMRNIPVAAKLINSYRGTSYSAEYPNPKDSSSFKGDNGKSLKGQAKQLWVREDHRERVYWGQGKVQVMKWRLVGNVVIEFRSWPPTPSTTDKTCYSIRFTMFPANAFINTVMNMGMFRSVAVGKIKDILDDIMKSSQDYSAGKKPDHPVKYTPEETKVLDEFDRLYKAGR